MLYRNVLFLIILVSVKKENQKNRVKTTTHPCMYGLVGAGYRCDGMVGLADGMAAGSWYSVLRHLSSNFCSMLCAFEADLMSINDTVAHTPLPPSATSSFDLASILTLCTRPYLRQTHVNISHRHTV